MWGDLYTITPGLLCLDSDIYPRSKKKKRITVSLYQYLMYTLASYPRNVKVPVSVPDGPDAAS